MSQIRDADTSFAVVGSALIRMGKLSEADLARVVQEQAVQNIGFTDAALRLGLISKADIDTALGRAPAAGIAAIGRPAAELFVAHDSYHPQIESLRALRTNLLLQVPADTSIALAIVSAAARDGRSRLAAELALVLSQIGAPTLLLDADLRNPRQQYLFSLPTKGSLVAALDEFKAPQPQGVAGFPQLHVLGAGESVTNPLELLTRPRFGQMLDELRQRYRFIVIDTPPIGQYSDALAITNSAHRALFVTRLDHSRMADCKEAISRLSAAGTVVGSVLKSF